MMPKKSTERPHGNIKFTGDFTQQLPLSDEAIAAALEVMGHGRLHRYNLAKGETSQAALFEAEFAAYVGARYCLACASGGYALTLALRAIGVQPGESVLTNAFTLAPVPGAIASMAAVPIFVEVTDDLVIDLDDLQAKITASGARYLLLSHMRGHMVDMDALMTLCQGANVQLIEDCAHTMGAFWGGIPSGRHGAASCYSTQTYKHLNSGEGGVLICDDPEIMARATMLSGSYMHFERHGAGAAPQYFDQIKYDMPNCSGRMDNLRAALLRPQLRALDACVKQWNQRYARVEIALSTQPGIRLINRPIKGRFVGSSIQFSLPEFSESKIRALLTRCAQRGVDLKWFGDETPSGFTSRYDSWRYAPRQSLPQSDRILACLMDMRLPLTFSLQDCDLIAGIIRDEVGILFQMED